jgi:hypothetical protein
LITRIAWAAYKNKIPTNSTTSDFPPPENPDTSAVHVSFISYQVSHCLLSFFGCYSCGSNSAQTKDLVTEASLRELFGRYGEVTDVSIKKSAVDRVSLCCFYFLS